MAANVDIPPDAPPFTFKTADKSWLPMRWTWFIDCCNMAQRKPLVSQRPWLPHLQNHSPSIPGCGPMGHHGAGMVVLPILFGLLVKMQRNIEPFHWLLIPIPQIYLNYHVFL